MAEFVISSEDPTTEGLLIAYQQERGGVQATVGQMYQAIERAEAAYSALEAALDESGAFWVLAEYHAALQAPVADAIALLRVSMAGVMAVMEQMESAMPKGTVLFPGVPRNEDAR